MAISVIKDQKTEWVPNNQSSMSNGSSKNGNCGVFFIQSKTVLLNTSVMPKFVNTKCNVVNHYSYYGVAHNSLQLCYSEFEYSLWVSAAGKRHFQQNLNNVTTYERRTAKGRRGIEAGAVLPCLLPFCSAVADKCPKLNHNRSTKLMRHIILRLKTILSP